jgi:hypothetical protein
MNITKVLVSMPDDVVVVHQYKHSPLHTSSTTIDTDTDTDTDTDIDTASTSTYNEHTQAPSVYDEGTRPDVAAVKERLLPVAVSKDDEDRGTQTHPLGGTGTLRHNPTLTPTSTPTTGTSTKPHIEPLTKDEKEKWSKTKLVIYMTSHLPEHHTAYLPCWKDAIQRLEIFQYANLILFTSTVPTTEQWDQLPFRNVTIKMYENTDYQLGAMQAMIDPFVNNVTWFDEYDWVIRLNMDVLIRRDTWLIRTMLDPTINGIFHDCVSHETYSSNPLLHSDFYAFRPSAIDREQILNAPLTVAENQVTASFRNIYESRQFSYVVGANPSNGICRIVGVNSPVVHAHSMSKVCPDYYNYEVDGVNVV